MRMKGLGLALAWAALARSISVSMAQSNTVTNISVFLRGGGSYNLICNPLNNTNNNDITNLFHVVQDGDAIYRWNPTIQDLDPNPYDFRPPVPPGELKAWHFILQPGEAVFYLNAGHNVTQTFVGEIIHGPYTNPIPYGSIAVLGGGLYNAYGSISPVTQNITNVLAGLAPADGDQIFFWDPNTQDFAPNGPTYSAFLHSWFPSTNVVQPGIGFFYMRAAPEQSQWVRNYTVQ